MVKGGFVLPRAVDGDGQKAFFDPVHIDLLRDCRAAARGDRTFPHKDIFGGGGVARLDLVFGDFVIAQKGLSICGLDPNLFEFDNATGVLSPCRRGKRHRSCQQQGCQFFGGDALHLVSVPLQFVSLRGTGRRIDPTWLEFARSMIRRQMQQL